MDITDPECAPERLERPATSATPDGRRRPIWPPNGVGLAAAVVSLAVVFFASSTSSAAPTPPTLPADKPAVIAPNDSSAPTDEEPPDEATPEPADEEPPDEATPEPSDETPPVETAAPDATTPAVPPARATPDPFGSPAPTSPAPALEPPSTPQPGAEPTDALEPDAVDDDDPTHYADPNDEFDRQGVFVSLSAGIVNCRQPVCSAIAMGANGRFEIGHRTGRFIPFAGVSFGGSLIDTSDFNTPSEPSVAGTASLRFLDMVAGLRFAPNKEGRLDPFFVAAVGYSRVRESGKSGTRTFDIKFSRGGFRLGTGLAIYVSRRIAVAPRFDIVLPFSGTACFVDDLPLNDNDFDECRSVGDLVADSESVFDERFVRKAQPSPWTAAVDLRLVF